MNPLNKAGLETIAEATYRKTAEIGLRHAEVNLPYIQKTISDLDGAHSAGNSAIVISAGPSLHRNDSAKRIIASDYKGTIVATDGALGYCLRNDLIPDVVVSVDPHPTRIVRWFGDPELEICPPDDYFRRQDLDPYLSKDEIKRNQELIELVNCYGSKIRAVLSTSVAPSVTSRVLEVGMPIYWWNPIYDDYDEQGSHTRQVFELNNVPCMVTGGNCGTAAWVFAGAILGLKNVALLGMDLSYHPDTPLEITQYYTELRNIFGVRFAEAYIHVENPYLQQTWYTDPTYWWYQESFLELSGQATCATYNCTEGGIPFGGGIQWCSLEDFPDEVRESS